jgi:hypothetical protein
MGNMSCTSLFSAIWVNHTKDMKIHILSFFLWVARLACSSASGADETLIDRVLRDSNDPSAGQWSSLTANLDFSRILTDKKYDKVADQVIDRTLSSTTPVASSSSCSFAPASENDYYPEYAIAWRYLGISVDCNYQGNGHRSLQNNNGNMCARVLLYAVVSAIVSCRLVNGDLVLSFNQLSSYLAIST